MFEDSWLDAICYTVFFENTKGFLFHRIIVVPLNFLEEDINPFFCNHFRDKELKVLSIEETDAVWLSKETYQMV